MSPTAVAEDGTGAPGLVIGPPPPRQRPAARPSRPPGAWWGWRGLHGGAGTTTIARAIPGGVELTGSPEECRWPDLPVVVVCRSHTVGLEAAQQWAAEYGSAPTLLGLLVVADAPGRLPRSLERGIRLVAGGYPHVWRAPWMRGWRTAGPAGPGSLPPWAGRLMNDLASRTEMPL